MRIGKILSFLLWLLLLSNCGKQPIERNALFISLSGNDDWSGRLAQPNKSNTDGPFATFSRAQQAIQELKQSGNFPSAGLTIFIDGGNYSLAQTVTLTADDAGRPEAPVKWCAYPGKEVIFSGGIELSGFEKVSSLDQIDRIEKSCRDKIYVCDLKKMNIFNYGELRPKGFSFRPHQPLEMELFYNNRAMTLARYPNDGWLKIAEVPQSGKKLIHPGGLPHTRFGIPVGRHYGRFKYDSDRPKNWKVINDIWMHGYWSWDWADTYDKVANIDTTNKEIYPAAPYNGYGYTKGQRFYFLNVLEELDSPGEYYLDRQEGKLYFWPPGNLEEANISVSLLEVPLLVLENSSFVEIERITFQNSRTTAVKIMGGRDNKIAGCSFRNFGNVAVVIEGGQHNGIISCDIYENADGGILLSGGDRMTLTAGNNYVENNHLYNFGRIFRTYSPAVQIEGVGNRLTHNYIHDSPHAGVLFNGNEHILEYNEIHDIAQETGDVGAFYIGRDWTCRGNIIRYNYFHHLFGPGLYGVNAVYLDDWASGTTIYGNIFYKAGRAAFIGGGRDNVVANNIFVECDPSVHVDARGLSWAKYYFDKSDPNYVNTLFERMDAVKYSQLRYSEKYPKLITLYDDEPAQPKYNQIIGNVSYNGRFIDLYDKLDFEIVAVENNLIADTVICRSSLESDQSSNFQTFKFGHQPTMEKMKANKFLLGDPGFQAVSQENFVLTVNSPVWDLGFKKIPVERIGLYVDEYRKHLPQKKRNVASLR